MHLQLMQNNLGWPVFRLRMSKRIRQGPSTSIDRRRRPPERYRGCRVEAQVTKVTTDIFAVAPRFEAERENRNVIPGYILQAGFNLVRPVSDNRAYVLGLPAKTGGWVFAGAVSLLSLRTSAVGSWKQASCRRKLPLIP